MFGKFLSLFTNKAPKSEEVKMVTCCFCDEAFELIQGDTLLIEDTPSLLISTAIKVTISCPSCDGEEVIP
jgi:hypothetical protein